MDEEKSNAGGSSTEGRSAREPDGEGGTDEGTSRPTPVREIMRAGPGGGESWEPPSRSFEHQGRAWLVTLVGQTVTGLPQDPGAPLMHLHFAPADAPDRPERELLAVGRDLDHLYEEELRQLLDRSRELARDP